MIFTCSACDAESASLVEQALGNFLEAVTHLIKRWINDASPVFHTLGYERRQPMIPYFVTARHCLGIVNVYHGSGGTVVAVVIVINEVDRYGQLVAEIKSRVDFHNYGLVIVRAHDKPVGM